MKNGKIIILDLRDSPWVDGPGRTTLETASRIDHTKYHMIVAGFTGGSQNNNEYTREAARRGLEVARLQERGALDPGVVKQVLKLIDQHAVDILHTHELRSNVIGLLCARLRHLPVITTCHGWIANNLKGRLRVLLDRFTLYFVDHILVVSKKLQAQLNRQGIRGHRIAALPNAVAFESFNENKNGKVFRDELGVPPGTILVASIGRLSPEKGPAEFIQAARIVLRQFEAIRFILIGVGPERAKLEQLVDESGCADKFVFCGYRADMPAIYPSLDLVVQSSFTEGMPNVILEAASMEIPVIATNVGGTSEIIEQDVSGTLVTPGKTDQLAAAILDFLQNRPKYAGFAHAAQVSVRNRFSYSSRTDRMMQIYDSLLHGRTKSG